MKRILFTLTLLPAAGLADSDSDYVNFIRQIQQDTGVEWDITVPSEGDSLVSPTGVSEDGAFFELWSVHNMTTTEYLLDEQFVTSYTPNATVEILTGDPYQAVRRTRSDQPFQVRITVSGLLDPSDPAYPGAPDAAKMVDYGHSTFAYPEGSHSLEGTENPAGTLTEEGTMEDNTTATVTFNVTNLTGPDLSTVRGEEVFTISALADFGVSATILDSARVQIWPIAQGSLGGYDPAETYETVPPVTVTLNDLYPSSATFLRVYPGPQTADPENATIINTSYVVIDDSVPQNRTLVLKDLDRYFKVHGLHTMEIIHVTPFGADLVQSAGISVDRTVEFVGSLFANE